jgi:hypothetical protein
MIRIFSLPGKCSLLSISVVSGYLLVGQASTHTKMHFVAYIALNIRKYINYIIDCM